MKKLLLITLLISNIAISEVKEDFYELPSSKRVKQSINTSFKSYHFQIPFYAGLASMILFDGEVSDNASKHTPIFGSQANAKQWSDTLLYSLIPIMYFSALSADLPDTDESKFSQRLKFLTFQTLMIVSDYLLIHSVKSVVQRSRPDESDRLSFPSGHSSVSSGLSRTVYNNVQNSRYRDTLLGSTLEYGSFAMAGTVAWGRVEAKKHYLSDILLGNAFGALISDVIYSSFLDVDPSISTSLFLHNDKTTLQISYFF